MPLLSRANFPPGGFLYREPALNWEAPRQGLPFEMVVAQIQAVRAANPSTRLSTAATVCADALDAYTCARLHNDPRWCVSEDTVVAKAIQAKRAAVACGSCGARRARSST